MLKKKLSFAVSLGLLLSNTTTTLGAGSWEDILVTGRRKELGNELIR